MVIRPEDRPRIVLLSLAIVGVVAYMLIFVLPRLTRRRAMVAATSTPAATAFNAPALGPDLSGENVMARREQNPADIDAESSIPPAPSRDPFTPPVRMLTASAGPPPSVSRPPGKPVRPGPSPGLPHWPPSTGSLQGDGLSPAPVEPPPLPNVELKGVIAGEPAVAVVNVDGQTFYKQEGESLGQGLSLKKISEAGVVIQRALPGSRKNYILAVGHALKAEPGRRAAPPLSTSPVPTGESPSRLEPASRPPDRPPTEEASPRPAAPPGDAQRSATTGASTPTAAARTAAVSSTPFSSMRRRALPKRRYVRRYRRLVSPPVTLRFTGRRL